MNAVLRQLISDNPGKTDAEVAALYPDAAKVERDGTVTYVTLADLWGKATAAAFATALAAADPFANVSLSIGVHPNHPDVVASLAACVAHDPPLLTQQQSDAVRWVIPAAPSESDVAAERAVMGAESAYQANVAVYNAYADDYAAYVAALRSGDLAAPAPKGLAREA